MLEKNLGTAHNSVETRSLKAFSFSPSCSYVSIMAIPMKSFMIAILALLALCFKGCHSHVHVDHHHDNEVHQHDYIEPRFLKQNAAKPAKVQGKAPTTGTKKMKEICGFKSPSNKQLQNITNALSSLGDFNTNNIITVTVFFHIITDGSNGDLSLEDIDKQIAVLNDRYGSSGFYFNLQRVYTTVSSKWFNFQPFSQNDLDMRQRLHFGDRSVLNVYSVDMSKSGFTGIAYPYFFDDFFIARPDRLTLDGVAIDYRTLPGGSSDYSLGLTLVHEVGHWLGLLHTFHPNSMDKFGDCSVTDTQFDGDLIIDTPPEDRPALWWVQKYGWGCKELDNHINLCTDKGSIVSSVAHFASSLSDIQIWQV